MKISKIKNGGIRNIVIPGEYAFHGWEKFRGCLQSFFYRRNNQEAEKIYGRKENPGDQRGVKNMNGGKKVEEN